jgi:hypothetical protein
MNGPLHFVSDLPGVPAVYAMYGGRGRGAYVAYVGLAKSLRTRVDQHLVRRDSSVTTRASAVSLNPDLVTEVRWWGHPDFDKQDVLEAAELVAFDVFEPALRSRGNITDRAKALYADSQFCEQMRSLFSDRPQGVLVLPTLREAWERITELEERVRALEKRLAEAGDS